jgi:hypothetical protein
MIERIIQWFRDLFDLDVMDKQVAEISALRSAAAEHKISVSVKPYTDAGAYYFYAEPGRQSERMTRVRTKATVKGTYRFDGDKGSYFFSKKDKGTPVILVFTDHGKLKRKTINI